MLETKRSVLCFGHLQLCIRHCNVECTSLPDLESADVCEAQSLSLSYFAHRSFVSASSVLSVVAYHQ